MSTLPEILQASELAISQNGTYPVPDKSMDTLLNVPGILIGGQTLTQRGIKRVKPSAHSFLSANTTTYPGFKIGGTAMTLANVGTQPHSCDSSHVLISFGPGTISLYNQNGYLYAGNNTLGSLEAASYLTVNKRGIKYVIIHACAGGGGGGGGSGMFKGWAGASGAVYIAIINLSPFTIDEPLVITIGSGGAGRNYLQNERGETGGATTISSIHATYHGTLVISGGTGGKMGGTSEGQGIGGQAAYYNGGASLPGVIHSLLQPGEGVGADGGTGNPPLGGPLPVYSYLDPNPAATNVLSSQSFDASLIGSGGDGGAAFGAGQAGKPGSVYIYY